MKRLTRYLPTKSSIVQEIKIPYRILLFWRDSSGSCSWLVAVVREHYDVFGLVMTLRCLQTFLYLVDQRSPSPTRVLGLYIMTCHCRCAQQMRNGWIRDSQVHQPQPEPEVRSSSFCKRVSTTSPLIYEVTCRLRCWRGCEGNCDVQIEIKTKRSRLRWLENIKRQVLPTSRILRKMTTAALETSPTRARQSALIQFGDSQPG